MKSAAFIVGGIGVIAEFSPLLSQLTISVPVSDIICSASL